MDELAVARTLRQQDGVISRRQVLAAGGTDSDIERLLRRREWARVADGVYVDHTGPLSAPQRRWAAVLFHWPAALAGRSALEAFGVRRAGARDDPDETVHLVVASERHLRRQPWIRVTRIKDFDARVQANLSPPRVRIEDALLQRASEERDEAAALAVLADACQTGHTTADRLVESLQCTTRLPRRRFLLDVLQDVASGAYSVLEARYLREVERAHGLPRGVRQRRVAGDRGAAYRDVEYVELHTIVELDGRLGHDEAKDRWQDLDRDLAGAVDGALTIRVGWKQVLEPCRLAGSVGRILGRRGWTGRPTGCGPGCGLSQLRGGEPNESSEIGGDDGASPASDAGDEPLTG